MSTHNIPFLNMKKKITLNYLKSADMGFFHRDSRMSCETAVVNKPSVFQPLKASLQPITDTTEVDHEV